MESPFEFVTRLIELTEHEMRAEEDEMSVLASSCPFSTLVQHGLGLTGLAPVSVTVGLGGRTLVALERSSAHSDSKAFETHHSFRPGDAVQVQDATIQHAASSKARTKKKQQTFADPAAAKGTRATVWKVTDTRITVALDKRSASETGQEQDEDDDLPVNVRIIKMSNPATYKRQLFALKLVQRSLEQGKPLSRMAQIVLGLASPTVLPTGGDIQLTDSTLNDSQQQAVAQALGSELCLVWGPPGTGKTQVVAEIIRQLVAKGERVLVCGGSNLSVDNVLQRLSSSTSQLANKAPIAVTRLGHPARVLSALERYTLDAQTAGSDTAELVKDIKLDLEKLEGQLRGTGKDRIKGSARKDAWAQVRDLRRDYRKREGGIVESVLGHAQCVVGTTHGVGSREVAAQKFDTIIIDEAAQCAEPACWIPLALQQGAQRLVLAGDHLQLPPTIKSTSVTFKLTKKTLPVMSTSTQQSEAAAPPDASDKQQKHAPTAALVDREQPVEPAAILDIPSHGPKQMQLPTTLEMTLFERLVSLHGPKIRKMLEVSYRFSDDICKFPSQALYEGRLDDEDLDEGLIFYDTAGLGMLEREGEDSGSLTESKSNENEAEICRQCVERLVEHGRVPSSAISIVSPYNAQVAILAKTIKTRWPDIEVGSVDGLQGRENDVVIISLVRSNDRGEVGFLAEKRRLNVAMTRPRRQLIVIGDSSTVGKGSGYLKQWMRFLEEHAFVQVPE
ncbi:hypothetical protein OIV83_003920 [Microbotryomycetes sp. JL201]|nr:hypothetical protein OIV83_003920 [Microbotryomycetes sp. JL201]